MSRMAGKARWALGAVAVLAGAGLITRSIVARQHERAAITQSAAGAQAGALTLRPDDLAQVRAQELVLTIPVSGSLRAVRTAVVKSRVGGELLSLPVREGDRVTRGQLLGRIDDTESRHRLEQARQQAASARAQWQIAQRALENNQALVAQGFISKNALDTSQANAAAAKATELAARAALDLARQTLADTRLTSPMAGTVSQRYANAGERVAPEGRVLEVVDLSKLEIEVPLRPQDIAQVRVGTPATLQIEGLAEPIAAKVARINPSADPATRAVTAYLSVNGHPALRQGLFAQGQLELGRQRGLLLPLASVRRDAQGEFVQVLRQGRVVHQRVALGGEGLAVTEGGPAGRSVLVRPAGVGGGPGVSAPAAPGASLREGEQVLKESLGVLAEGTVVELAAAPPPR